MQASAWVGEFGEMMIADCDTEVDFKQLLADSQDHPVFLLKHSTACGTSGYALRLFQQFAEKHPEVDCRRVLVRERRDLSDLIAEATGIVHESPQAILFHNGRPVWNASHYDIDADALTAALADASTA